MNDQDECLIHYGVLGMKWGVRRQRKKASRNTNKASKLQKKIDARNAVIAEQKNSLRNENARRVESKARVTNSKNEIRKLGNKVKNNDYGLLFRGHKEKKTKQELESARKEYKKAVDLDLEIEANQTRIRADIQSGKDLVARYQKQQTKYLDKASIARGKELANQLKLDEKLKKK